MLCFKHAQMGISNDLTGKQCFFTAQPPRGHEQLQLVPSCISQSIVWLENVPWPGWDLEILGWWVWVSCWSLWSGCAGLQT